MRAQKPLPKQDPFAKWNLRTSADLAKPLPPVEWLCKHLSIAPGAANVFAGYGFSGKTMALQSLALAVAAGKSLWGLFSVRSGPVTHFDYEQGFNVTCDRYQRLGRGMGIYNLEEVPNLRVASLPHIYLDDKDAFEQLCALLEGNVLVIIDSLKAAFPDLDENSSDSRKAIDMLSRVGARVGCAIIIIHHARKPQKEAAGGIRAAMRGSGALYDAPQGVFILEAEKGQPTIVHHEKERVWGNVLPPFGLMFEDLLTPQEFLKEGEQPDPRWGLKVIHLDKEQIASFNQRKQEQALDKKKDELLKAFFKFFEDNGYAIKQSSSAIQAMVKGDTNTKRVVWQSMLTSGLLTRTGSPKDPVWTVLRQADAAAE